MEETAVLHVPTLFLDLDGVMLSHNYYRKLHELDLALLTKAKEDKTLDPDCVVVLNRILKTAKPELIISSSWRRFMDKQALQHLFTVQGIDYLITDYTPYLTQDGQRVERGVEIAEWLKLHPKDRAVAILDDDADMGMLGQYLVQTDAVTGLTEVEGEAVIKLLQS